MLFQRRWGKIRFPSASKQMWRITECAVWEWKFCAPATGQRVLLTTDVSKKEKLGDFYVLGPVNAKEMYLPNASLLQNQS